MTGADLVVFLQQLSDAVHELWERWQDAQRDVQTNGAAQEQLLLPSDVGAPRFFVVTPAQAFASETVLIAERTRDDVLARFESWASWWGDCAGLALEAAATGVPVRALRLLAGAPSVLIDDADLLSLNLPARIAGAGGESRPAEVGEVRANLWGSTWSAAGLRFPDLPTEDELGTLVEQCTASGGMSIDEATRIKNSHDRLLGSISAHLFVTRAETLGEGYEAERLQDASARADRRFEQLAAYAQEITGWVERAHGHNELLQSSD